MIYDEPIIQALKSNSKVFYQSSTEIIMFCPFCNDSTRKGPGKVPTHGHLYISLNEPVYHCQRCKTSGHIITLLSVYKYAGKLPEKVIEFKNGQRKQHLSSIIHEEEIELKFEYDMNRLPSEKIEYLIKRRVLNPKKDIHEQLMDLKLVVDVEKFVNDNIHIVGGLRNQGLYKELIKTYVGHVAYANSGIEFRTFNNNIDSRYRYYRYKIQDTHLFWAYRYNNEKLRKLPINIISNKPIIMAEGVYDLMFIHTKQKSVVEKYINKSLDDCILVACGKKYYDGFNFITKKVFNLTPEIIVLLDSDNILTRSIKNIFEYSSAKSSIFLRNKGHSDFNEFPLDPVAVF